MNKKTATTIFESLSSEVRLDVFRLLVKTGLDGLVAGEIAATLDIPNTNLSFHLKAMTHAGMVTVQQEGRFQRYRANFPLMLETVAYLTEECCARNPDQGATMRNESNCSPSVLPHITPAKKSEIT